MYYLRNSRFGDVFFHEMHEELMNPIAVPNARFKSDHLRFIGLILFWFLISFPGIRCDLVVGEK